MKTRSAYNPTSSTKAYYTLNGNSFDISGNSNTGTDTTITYPQGKFGQAAKFDGSTSKIVSSAFGLTNTSDFTILMWGKLASEIGAGAYELFEMNFPTNRFSVGEYQFNGGTRRIVFDWGAGISAIFNVALGITNWNFFTFVKSGSTITLYVNRSSVATGTIGSAGGSGSNTTNMGNSGGGTNPYNGLIDEVIIESRAWTPAEVSTYYRKSMLNYGAKKSWLSKFLGIVYTLTCTPTSFSYTPKTDINYRTIKMLCSPAVYVFTGLSVAFSRAKMYFIACLPTSFTFTGMSTIFYRIVKVICLPVSFTFTGLTMSFKKIFKIACQPAVFIFKGLVSKIIAPLHTFWIKYSPRTTTWVKYLPNITTWIKKITGI